MREHYVNDDPTKANTALGYQSMWDITNGTYNIALGNQTMYHIENGSEKNVAIGSQSMFNGKNTWNVSIGYEALKRDGVNTESSKNIAIGYQPNYKNTTGSENVSIGYQSQYENTSGEKNIGIGSSSLHDNTDGNDNISIGWESLKTNITSNKNISIGNESLKNAGSLSYTRADENISIGNKSLTAHKQGSYNTYLGNNAGEYDISGQENTAIGYNAFNKNIDGKGNTSLGYKSGEACKGDYNIIVGYEADIPGEGNDSTDGAVGFGKFVDYSISIGYKSQIKSSQNIVIGQESLIDFPRNSEGVRTDSNDISGSIAIGNFSNVSKRRSMALGVDSSCNLHENTIVIGETIEYKWLKHDHAKRTGDDKYYNSGSSRNFDETVKVCIGTQDFEGIDGLPYKFRVDGSANITGNLKVDGDIIMTGDTIQTVDHEIIRFSEQLDISNTGTAPALKITQYGSGTSNNDYNFAEGSIVEIFDGDNENNGDPNTRVFHIKNGGNTFVRNNFDVSRNVMIYNYNPGDPNIRDPNEADPSYNHLTIGCYPGSFQNHNSNMRNTRDFLDDINVNSQIQNSYPNRPTKYLPKIGGETFNNGIKDSDYEIYDFAGGRSGADKTYHTKGQYSLEVSGNVFIHDYMKIETGRPFENSFEVHTTDGIQLPCGNIQERPGNYYYHANNPYPNINDSIYPKISPNDPTSTRVYEVNNFTGNSSDGSIRYNTDTSQCEVYAGGKMWTGLAGYRTEQPPHLLKYDLGQSQISSPGDLPIKHNSRNLSIEKSYFGVNTAWKKVDTVYYDAFTGLPYPLYHYTIIDVKHDHGWQLFKVLPGNVDQNGDETSPAITYNFDGRVGVNTFTTVSLSDLPNYPEKPTIDPSNGSLDLNADISYNVRVYTLNKSRKKPNIIYLDNLFLLRVAYPGVVNFAHSLYGNDVGNPSQKYYSFQNYLQYNVKMNLSFQRANVDNIGTTNDNAVINSNGVDIFDPNSTSYPSIIQYNVKMYVVSTKCMYDGDTNTFVRITGSNNVKNPLTTSIGDYTGNTIADSYGTFNAPKTYEIVNSIDDIGQQDVSFQHILLPGTKYGIKLSAKNNRNPYFSHSEIQASSSDPAFDELENAYTPTSPTVGGDFPVYTTMPYYTNVDGFVPSSSSDDPLYIKYISSSDLIPLDVSNITFGGHRTIAVFDPNEESNYKYIPYYNRHSHNDWGTGKYFDISGEENFYVNFNIQGSNCINQTVSTAKLLVNRNTSILSTHTLTYRNSSGINHFIETTGNGNIENNVLSLDTTLLDSASEDINKGFVKTANFKITPSTTAQIATSSNIVPHRDIYSIYYEIESPVERESGVTGGYLDASSLTMITNVDTSYNFYVDDYNSTPSVSSNTGTITVDSVNLLFLYGIPSSKLVSLNVSYTLNNYADQFLPAVEINGGKTLVSKTIINSVGINSTKFGSQQNYDTNDRKLYNGIDENYNISYQPIVGVSAQWPNIYLLDSYHTTTTTDLQYKVLGYHIGNNLSSTYDNVSLTSNEQTELGTFNFTPDVPIWTDRNSFNKDSNGLISTIKSEANNVYRPDSYDPTIGSYDNNIRVGSKLDVTANNFELDERELIYFDGKFIGPGYISNLNFNPFDSSQAPSEINGRPSGSEYTWNNDRDNTHKPLYLEGTPEDPDKLKFLILKIPPTQQVLDTGIVDISNLLISGNNLDYYISDDGSWPSTLDGLYIWITQVHNSETYYGSVNKLFNPTETNWYINNNNVSLSNAYASESSARTLDNPNELRFNNDFPDSMYLIIGLDNSCTHYINFEV